MLDSQVLFAVPSVNSSSSVYLQRRDGFTIPSPLQPVETSSASDFGLSLCPTTGGVNQSMGGMHGSPLSIRFGRDLVTGCVARLNRTALRDMCCVGADTCSGSFLSPYMLASGVPSFLQPLSGYGTGTRSCLS